MRDRYENDPLMIARQTHKRRSEYCGHPDGSCCVVCTTDERHVAFPCPAVNEERCAYVMDDYRCVQHESHVARDGDRHLVENDYGMRMVVADVCGSKHPRSDDIRYACLMEPNHPPPHTDGRDTW